MPRKKKTAKYNYLIEYVQEAVDARESLKSICTRAISAYQQKPSRNTYRENAYRYKQSIANTASIEQLTAVNSICESIPDATNDTVFNAVETFVSMAMGGADQFEYQPADSYLTKDTELVERLSALAKFFHEDNQIDAIIPQVARNMMMQGKAVLFLNPIKDGRFQVSLIDAWNKLSDPRQLKTNRKRFEGYTEVTHWSTLKDHIIKNQKDYILSTINDVDGYVNELSGSFNHWENEIREDLNTFSSIYKAKTSQSVNDKGEPVSPTEIGYKGDDVEVAYIWDTINDVYGIVVNRRFLVVATEHPYRKTVKVDYARSDGRPDSHQVTVELDSPMVTIPYIKMPNETFSVSPLFYCLDDFDAICSMESVMNHNFSIMAPITFLGSSFDAEQVALLSQVAGQIAEGTMNTLQVMNKTHDMSPIISAIQRREQRIKRMLGATDQYELAQMLGNRATASEVSTMSGTIAQRMNVPLANLECGMSELTQKMFAMYIIFGDKDEFTFSNNGSVSTVSKVDMLGRSIIRAKLKSQIKIQQQEQARSALMVLQTLINLKQVNPDVLVSTLVPIITQGVVNRRQAEAFVSTDSLDASTVEQLKQLVSAAPQSVLDQSDMAAMTPEGVDSMMQAVQTGMMDYSNPNPTVNTGVDNYYAGVEANQSNPMNGLI